MLLNLRSINLIRSFQSRNMSCMKNLAYVNGKWVSANSCKTFPVMNPVDCQTITEVPDMDAEDAKEAVEAASKAFQVYRRTTAKERSDLLRNWYVSHKS